MVEITVFWSDYLQLNSEIALSLQPQISLNEWLLNHHSVNKSLNTDKSNEGSIDEKERTRGTETVTDSFTV